MKLYYSETLNPRKACAAARYLNSPVEFVQVDLVAGEQRSDRFLSMNPNGKVPVLEDGEFVVWEADAIMCYLADKAKSDFWPRDARQFEVLRWLSWDARHFSAATTTLWFENMVKPHIGLGPTDGALVRAATEHFMTFAPILDAHLVTRDYVVGDNITVADFALASALPYAEPAGIPMRGLPAIRRWHERLQCLDAWNDPFPQTTSGTTKSQAG